MINNRNDDDRKRREAWFALFGALLLGGFFLFSGCQAQIFPSLNAVAQGSLFPVASTTPTPTPVPATPTTPPVVVVPPVVVAATATPTTPPTVAVTPRAKEGPLTVPFVNRDGVTTTQSYSGPTPITVSGTGQAQGTQHSDAFYLYTDANGKDITPVHSKNNGILCINSKPVDQYVLTIPAYNPSHIYNVSLNAPGGPLKFGVCDAPDHFFDNTGSFTVAFE